MKHTKTPWKASGIVQSAPDTEGDMLIHTEGGLHVAEVFQVQNLKHKDPEQSRANAAFIVKACNAHDELVSALHHAIGVFACIPEETKEEMEKAFGDSIDDLAPLVEPREGQVEVKSRDKQLEPI